MFGKLMGVRSRSRRGIVVIGVVVAGCCSCGGTGTTGTQYASGYSALPASCTDVSTAAGDALHQFAGALPPAGPQPVTTGELDSAVAQTLDCTITYEDPIPHPDKVSTPEPLSRTARIQLVVWTTPTVLAPTTTSTTAEPTTSGATTPVRGIGDHADITPQRMDENHVTMAVRTKLGNLEVDVDTQGLNWSGASGTAPTGDSPALRSNLASSAESIAAALLHNLSASLPRKTLRPESATTSAPAVTTTPATTTPTAPQQVWDPCTIPDADLTAAGLNPQSKKTGTPDPKEKQCSWTGSSHDVDIFTWDSLFTDLAYQAYAQPRPVMVGDRRALLAVNSGIPDNAYCTLLFDIPQVTTRDGIKAGVVQVEATTKTSADHDTSANHDALCTELTRLAVPLTQHFPASR